MAVSAEFNLEQERFIIDELSCLAESHIESSKGKLELLLLDPATAPSQATFHLEGSSQPSDTIDNLASIAEPRFPDMQEAITDNELGQKALEQSGDILNEGGNVIIATNHGSLTDIGLVLAAFYRPLREQGYDFAPSIIISSMISVIAHKLGDEAVPATDTLKLLCDDIYKSFPLTGAIKKSLLYTHMSTELKSHNAQMAKAVMRRLGQDSLVLAMAPSGTKDKQHGDEYQLGKVNDGTARIMQAQNTYVLPVAVWLNDDEPVLKVCDTPKRLESNDNVGQMMNIIANTLNSNIKDKKFRYQGN